MNFRPTLLWKADAFNILLVACFCLMMTSSAVMAVQEEDETAFVSAIAPAEIYDWVLDPRTGRVFAAPVKGTEVIEFDLTMNREARRIETGKVMRQLVVKKNYLVAVNQSGKSIEVVDLNTNKVQGSIALDSSKYISTAAASQKDDWLVFIVTHAEQQYSNPVLQVVDLRKMEVIASLTEELTRGSRTDIVNLAISDRGDAFVSDRRGYTSSSGGDISVIKNATTFLRKTSPSETYGVIQSGPANRYWCFGEQLVDYHTGETKRKFSGHIVDVHRQADLAVSLDVAKKEIRFWRSSDAKMLKSISVPELENNLSSSRSRRKTWSFDREIDDPVLQFDYKNNAVFCAMRKSCFLIPCDDLIESVGPQFLLWGVGEQKARVGESILIPLQTTNPRWMENAELSVVEPTLGARIEKNQLVWTPTGNQIGPQSITVQIVNGEKKDTLKIPVKVNGFQIDTDITAQAWHVSPSGRYGIVWGNEKPTNGTNRPSSPSEGAKKLVIVDLQEEKILGTQKLTKPIQFATISEDAYFVFGKNSAVAYRVSLKDFEDRKRIFLPGSAIWANQQVDGALVVGCRDEKTPGGSVRQIVLAAKTLQVDPDDPRNNLSGSFSHSSTPLVASGKERVTDKTHTYNTRTGKVVTIETPYNLGFPLSDDRSMQGFQFSHGASNIQNKMWGRIFESNYLKDGSGNRLAQISAPFEMSSDYPVGVAFKAETKNTNQTFTYRGELQFYELVEGSQLGVVTLFDEPLDRSRNYSTHTFYGYNPFSPLVIRGKTAWIMHLGTIYQTSISNDIIKQANRPLQIAPPEVVTVDLSKPTTELKLVCPDYPKSTFELNNQLKDVELSEDGTLKIDGSRIWSKKATELMRSFQGFSRASRNQQNDDLKKFSRKKYGIPDNKTGIVIPVSVTATGVDGQSDRIQFVLIGLGDSGQLEDEKAKIVAAQKKAQEEAQRRREVAMAELEARKMLDQKRLEENATIENSNDRRGEGDEPAVDRVAELEKRMRRLEALIDSLIQKIDKLEKNR